MDDDPVLWKEVLVRPKILVPVDGSAAAAAALRKIAPLIRAMDATCVVLAVAEPKMDGRFERFAGAEHASIVEVERSYVDQQADWLIRHGVAAEAHLEARPGITVAEAITDYASEHGVDWIAMPTHGRSGVGRAVFGSVFQAVLKRSPVPLIVFPEATLQPEEDDVAMVRTAG